MTARVASLWRHPIKAHGREEMREARLEPGKCLPWDRRWAVAHEASKADGSGWAPCANFSRGAKAPALMAITARSDEAAGTVTLAHPDRPEITFDPDGDPSAFLAWVRPLMPEGRAAPARILRAEGRGMTDSDFPSVAIYNATTHAAVEARMGRPLSIHRWRGNIWLNGPDAWAERGWIGREIRIGGAVLAVRAPITRCLATTANPETGKRDADTLSTLDHWGHRDFGVYAEVIEGGDVTVGDAAVLP